MNGMTDVILSRIDDMSDKLDELERRYVSVSQDAVERTLVSTRYWNQNRS